MKLESGRTTWRSQQRRQPREGLFTWVTVKVGNAWKIRASHNSNMNVIR